MALTSSGNKGQISQMEFAELYLNSLESSQYRNASGGIDLPRLLKDHGYLLSLDGFKLRHLDFRHANFNGISLSGANLIGARIDNADFTNANFKNVLVDEKYKYYFEKFKKSPLTHFFQKYITPNKRTEEETLGTEYILQR